MYRKYQRRRSSGTLSTSDVKRGPRPQYSPTAKKVGGKSPRSKTDEAINIDKKKRDDGEGPGRRTGVPDELMGQEVPA
ncbi:hypothetical protein THAOC_14874, partial [Thalassiosira oceanica]